MPKVTYRGYLITSVKLKLHWFDMLWIAAGFLCRFQFVLHYFVADLLWIVVDLLYLYEDDDDDEIAYFSVR